MPPASFGGANANEKFAHVDIVTIPGRVGQRIRNELIFQTTGGGMAPTPTMRLEIAIRESVTSTLVRTDGDAQAQIYGLEAAFKLVRISDNSVVADRHELCAAPALSASSRSSPTCARARMPRTEPPAPSARI